MHPGDVFLVNIVSSRSNDPSRDRGATHERKLNLVVISDSGRCMALWIRDHMKGKYTGAVVIFALDLQLSCHKMMSHVQ